MIWPLQMMLFGCRRASYDSLTNTLTLDGWARFEMDYMEAAGILALRPLIETLVMRIAEDPQSAATSAARPLEIELRDLLVALSSPRANDASDVAGELAGSSASDVLGLERDADVSFNFGNWQQGSPFQSGPYSQMPWGPQFGPPGSPFRQPLGRYSYFNSDTIQKVYSALSAPRSYYSYSIYIFASL